MIIYNTEELDKIPIEDIQFTITDQLLLETLLMEIRGKTISYSAYIKKKDKEEENHLLEEITRLEEDIENIAENKDKIEDMRFQLQHIRAKKIEGIIIRSKAQWIKEGEKTTRYFCSLESRNFVNKSVSFLDKGNGEIISEQENILEEVHNFYNSLYSHKEVQDTDLDYLKTEAVVLNEEEKQKLEGEISLTEIAESLKNMKNNKSPGPDGFTTEFFKFFFKDIGHFLLRSYNESFNNGCLSITQYQGVITCIPKEGKPKQFLKNWRPISLLNVTYKILSACVASRIKQVLPCIIHESQKGFMKGRYIGENIRLIYDTLVVTETENIPGLLLMVDFEKAFDSISWKFIEKALRFFEFPNNILNWFKVLYKKPMSCISFNGQYSKWFNIHRGCRQGDPISPYLYLICAEILSLMIRCNKSIKGIKIREKEILLSLFADDTTLYLDGTEKSFTEAITILELFTKISGLRVNNEKTQISWIGSRKNCGIEYMRDRNFIWDPGTFKTLGIHFSTKTEEISKLNFEGKIDEIKREIARWKKRHLTPLGKITIIKTLIISKLTYLFINIPDPTTDFINEVDQLLLRFLWGGKTNKIKKATICKSYEEGGLKMIDLNSFLSAMKLSWIRRLNIKSELQPLWSSFYPILNKLEHFGENYAKFCLAHINNIFWQHVLKHYRKLYQTKQGQNTDAADLFMEPIHYNKNIKRGNQVIYIKEWVTVGILKIEDILDNNGDILGYLEFKTKFEVPLTNFLVYQGVAQGIKCYMKETKNNPMKYNQIYAKELWACITAGSRNIKNKLQEDNSLPTATKKMEPIF